MTRRWNSWIWYWERVPTVNVKLDIAIFLLWKVLRNVNMHSNLVELRDGRKPPAAR